MKLKLACGRVGMRDHKGKPATTFVQNPGDVIDIADTKEAERMLEAGIATKYEEKERK